MTSKSTPIPAHWDLVGKRPTVLDMIKDGARRVSVYAIANLVLFWWQQADLLADQAAIPAMWVCALLGGVELGKCIARGLRDA